MPVETPVAPAAVSSAPAKEPSTPASAPEPAANPTTQTTSAIRQDRMNDMRAQLKAHMDKSDGTPATPARTPEPPTTQGKVEEKAAEAAVPNPKETPVKAKEKTKKADDSAKSVKISRTDGEGKAAEIEVTFDQAKRAILRDGYSASVINKMTDEEVLDMGARRFVAQSDQDRAWNDARLERQRLAEGKAKAPASPGSPATAAKLEADAKAAAPAQTAQPQPSPAETPAQDPGIQADLAALQEQLGPDASAVLGRILGRLQQPGTNPLEADVTGMKTQLQQQQEFGNNVLGLLVKERFDRGFESVAEDFPQLEGEGSDAIRADIEANWNAIAQSGRWKQPLEPAAFKSILREAINARLGNETKETHARQLVKRQSMEKNGQIPSTQSRSESPAQALSDKDRMRAVMRTLMNTGSREEAIRQNHELLRQSG